MTIGFTEINLEKKNDLKIVYLKFTGKLTKEDYEEFVPQLDYILDHNERVSILVELIDFQGWSLGAVWEDTKFGVRHFGDIRRLAILGDRKWQKDISLFVAPFTKADVRFFETGQKDKAQAWVREEEH